MRLQAAVAQLPHERFIGAIGECDISERDALRRRGGSVSQQVAHLAAAAVACRTSLVVGPLTLHGRIHCQQQVGFLAFGQFCAYGGNMCFYRLAQRPVLEGRDTIGALFGGIQYAHRRRLEHVTVDEAREQRHPGLIGAGVDHHAVIYVQRRDPVAQSLLLINVQPVLGRVFLRERQKVDVMLGGLVYRAQVHAMVALAGRAVVADDLGGNLLLKLPQALLILRLPEPIDAVADLAVLPHRLPVPARLGGVRGD